MVVYLMDLFIKGIVAGILVSIPLGPIGVLLIQRTVHKGVRSGFISGLGVATADTFYAIVASFGISFLTNFFMSQQTPLKVIGGAILLIMGIKLIQAKVPKQHSFKTKTLSKGDVFSDFFSMFALTITNPLTIVLYGTVFTMLGLAIVQDNIQSASTLILGIYIGASIWWLLLSSGVNLFRHKINLKNLSRLNKITGVAVIGLALIAGISIFIS